MNGSEEKGAQPDGWKVTTIATVTDVVVSCDPQKQPDLAFNYVDISGIDNDRLVVAETKQLLGSDAPSRARRPLQSGDVVFSNVRTYLRNVARVDGVPQPAVASTGFTVLRPNKATLTDYLFRYVSSDEFLRLVTPRQTGTHYPATSNKVVREQAIPLPPIAEQRRIAMRLNKIETRRAAAAAHLHAARAGVERFRIAVLAAGCSGRLTGDWRESNPSERDGEMLIRELETRGAGRRVVAADEQLLDPPKGWKPLSLDRLLALVTSGSRGWARFYAEDGPLFIRAQNIRSDRLDLADAAHVRPPEGAEGARTQVISGDLLITITGANVTRAAFVESDIGEAYVNQHVALARPLIPEMTAFLHLWLVSPAHGRKRLLEDAYGAGKPGLNLTNIRAVPIALPPLEEQREIVHRVKTMLAAADRLTARIERTAETLDRATKASFSKAFRGELVPTEASLAEEEGRDFESAEQLLARVEEAEEPKVQSHGK